MARRLCDLVQNRPDHDVCGTHHAFAGGKEPATALNEALNEECRYGRFWVIAPVRFMAPGSKRSSVLFVVLGFVLGFIRPVKHTGGS